MTHRILVVDDEPDITALVAYHLAKAGFRVSTASNGPDALKAAREERPDIVILDLMLPGVSGYDVLAEIRDGTRPGTSASSCSPLGGRRPTGSAASRSAPTTTSPSRSRPRSCRCGCADCSAAWRSPPVTAGSTLAAGPDLHRPLRPPGERGGEGSA